MSRNESSYSVVDIEYAATRAGQLVYGSDDRLDDLIRELRRFLAETDSHRAADDKNGS